MKGSPRQATESLLVRGPEFIVVRVGEREWLHKTVRQATKQISTKNKQQNDNTIKDNTNDKYNTFNNTVHLLTTHYRTASPNLILPCFIIN